MSRGYISQYDMSEAPNNIPQAVARFFRHRSFRRLVAVLGIGAAVAIAYTALKTKIFDKDVDKTPEHSTTTSDAKVSENETIQTDSKKSEVTLFQVPRGFFTPAVSPFGMKLETFLRVAKIDYKVHVNHGGSEQGMESPWIKIGNEEIKNHADCIRLLCDKFHVDRWAGATSSRKTAARLVDTLFESKISWGIALWRWVYDGGRSMKDIQAGAPRNEGVLAGIKDSVSRAAYYNGIGRKSQGDVITDVIQALADAAAALGKHRFFLGNAPGEVDCHAFSLLAQMVWNMPGSPFHKAVQQQTPLMNYVNRMKETFWPDWDQMILNAAIATASMKCLRAEDDEEEKDANNNPEGPRGSKSSPSNVSAQRSATQCCTCDPTPAPVPQQTAQQQYANNAMHLQQQQQLQQQQFQQQQFQQQRQIQGQQQFMPQVVQQKMMPAYVQGVQGVQMPMAYNMVPVHQAFQPQHQQQYTVNALELMNPLMTPQQLYPKAQGPQGALSRPQIQIPRPSSNMTTQQAAEQPRQTHPVKSQNFGGFWM